MDIIYLYIILGIASYLISGINPAIVLSHLLYHEDIREKGSKNPGFTNFKRCYGNIGWLVFFLDIFKGILIGILAVVLFGLYKDEVTSYDCVKVGVAFCGLCGVIGHAYPIWYKFNGGKGFLVSATIIFFIDYRCGIICFLTMYILLLTTKYMSLSTMIAMLLGPVLILLFNIKSIDKVYIACILNLVQALFMCYRHKANIVRLINHTEHKFSFKK